MQYVKLSTTGRDNLLCDLQVKDAKPFICNQDIPSFHFLFLEDVITPSPA